MLSNLLSGKRTYVTLIAGVLATWGIYLLGSTCPTDPTALADAANQACGQFGDVKITLADAIKITWGSLAGGFLRAGIK